MMSISASREVASVLDEGVWDIKGKKWHQATPHEKYWFDSSGEDSGFDSAQEEVPVERGPLREGEEDRGGGEGRVAQRGKD